MFIIISNFCTQGVMMMTAGYFRLLPDLPKIFWRYPVSYINYGAWALQVIFNGVTKLVLGKKLNRYLIQFQTRKKN